jgi:hypothetical protein
MSNNATDIGLGALEGGLTLKTSMGMAGYYPAVDVDPAVAI